MISNNLKDLGSNIVDDVWMSVPVQASGIQNSRLVNSKVKALLCLSMLIRVYVLDPN